MSSDFIVLKNTEIYISGLEVVLVWGEYTETFVRNPKTQELRIYALADIPNILESWEGARYGWEELNKESTWKRHTDPASL